MKKLSIVIVSLIVFGWGINSLFDHWYKKYWNPMFDKLNTVIVDTGYYDGLYIGDSRVNFGINPYYIDSITGYNTFNIGLGGASFIEKKILLDSYLANHPAPKFVVISLSYSDILKWDNKFQNPLYFLFYLDNTIVANHLKAEGYRVSLVESCPLLKYIYFDDFNRTSIFRSMGKNSFLQAGGVYYKGYINNPSQPFREKNKKELTISDTAVKRSSLKDGFNSFIECIEKLRSKNCKIIFVYPPEWQPAEWDDAYLRVDSFYNSLAIKNNIPVLHYNTDADFTKNLFTDEIHVNFEGAIIYSKKLGGFIKQYMVNK